MAEHVYVSLWLSIKKPHDVAWNRCSPYADASTRNLITYGRRMPDIVAVRNVRGSRVDQ